MNESQENAPEAPGRADVTSDVAAESETEKSNKEHRAERRDARRWWIKLLAQPALILLSGIILFVSLGIAQKYGYLAAGGSAGQSQAASGGEAVQYICPMMCTPPQSEPGRCPVCAMELVPATSGGGNSDSRSIQIDAASRRVANIQTVAVQSVSMTRTIRAIGELSYDEGTLKTLSAYVDGRLERLYADYTGAVVEKGDHLALVYSPRLYSSQVELLLAKKSHQDSSSASISRVRTSSRDLYQNARQRLIELGMTKAQIEQLEKAGDANSRMHLCAPISGTVIEKLAVEGQYVKEGQAIYELADLSTVWLMLELFPKDAATISYGQKVEADVQSLPDRTFTGRVAFIDPNVDPTTRTVGVRVVIPNEDGLLRVGDYAKATIEAPVGGSTEQQRGFYDPELANKWISPRHPHVITDSPGACPICGVDLVPASQFGFSNEPSVASEALVVPRDAVLMAGTNSVLYVEVEPGRFEIRTVVLGPRCRDQIVIRRGVKEGEQVATRGNFLIDSQMQLAGNPSLIDPTRAVEKSDVTLTSEMLAEISKLPKEDQDQATNQQTCPVTDMSLGSMGTPKKVDVNGVSVFICCEGCRESLLEEPEKYLAKLSEPDDDAMYPPIGVPEIIDPQSGLPPIEAPQAVTKGSNEYGAERSAQPLAGEKRSEVLR